MGRKQRALKSRLLISYYLYFLHAINKQRGCFIEFVGIIPIFFPILEISSRIFA